MLDSKMYNTDHMRNTSHYPEPDLKWSRTLGTEDMYRLNKHETGTINPLEPVSHF